MSEKEEVSYEEFLRAKQAAKAPVGFPPTFLPDVLKGFQKYLCEWSLNLGRAAIYADCGLGKGHPDGTLLLTPTGWVPVEKVAVGDHLIGRNGTPCLVTGVFPKGEQDIYEVFFDDSTSLKVDSDHLWAVKSFNDKARKKDWRILSTSELLKSKLRYGKEGKSRTWHIPMVSPVEFPEKDFVIDPYVLGILLGDGCLSLSTQWTKPDRYIAEKVQARIPSNCTVNDLGNGDWSITTEPKRADNPITREIRRLGLNVRSWEKFVPDDYLFAAYDQRLDLLRGLMDTDGYSGESPEYSSSSRRLAEAVIFLTQSLGGTASLSVKEDTYYEYRGERKKGRLCYRVVLSMTGPCPFSLPRKADQWKSPSRGTGRWIDRIEQRGKQKSTCLSVDATDSLYVAENFIVTHNSVASLTFAQNVVEHTNKPTLILAPLAVSRQFVNEGKKFGIPCKQTQDGTVHKGINVTNYERISNYNPEDFAGVIGDECFAKGTRVQVIRLDNSSDYEYIENVREGDRILNVWGVDRVKACKKRRIDRVVILQIRGRGITCSEHHPFFTMHGWKFARDLRPGDHLMETAEAVRLVWDSILPQTCSKQDGEILRNELLREMENESSRTPSEGPQTRNIRQDRPQSLRVAEGGERVCEKEHRTTTEDDSNERQEVRRKNDRDEETQWNAQEVERKKRGKRDRDDDRSEGTTQQARRELDSRTFDKTRGVVDSSIPTVLQSRSGERVEKDSYRSRWEGPQEREEAYEGQKETRDARASRVDSVEILESGDHRLDQFRDADGSLYFYDLEASRHPSFSVEGFLVHNSSILKNSDGKTRRLVTDFMEKIKYRLLGTATPAPNDYMELGTSSEALGVMPYRNMLAMFFVNDGKSTQQWRLKGHAKTRFWQWMATWARAVRKPSDLGFDDEGYDLPELEIEQYLLPSGKKGTGLLPYEAKTLSELREERHRTLHSRCRKVADLCPSDRPAIIWCHLNSESELLTKLIPGAVEVKGSDKDSIKEKNLIGFSEGRIRVLVTKPKIAGFGLNWQHCADVFYFPSFSHESYYQAIRRCWRFGQMHRVKCRLVGSEAERRVLNSMLRKERQSIELYSGVVRHMNDALKREEASKARVKLELPSWL